jgi:large subunit ribosomal protein L22
MAEEKKDTEKKQTGRKPAAKKPSGSTTRKSGGTSTRRSSAKAKETATKGSGTAASASSKTADAKASEKATSTKPAAKKEPAKKAPAKKAETKSKGEPKPKPRSRRAAKEQAPERPVVNARARFVRVAPRKARLVADQVRGLPLEDALPLLRFSTRSAAQDIRKLLESAAANAEANHDLVADDLRIKDIHVDEGPTLRRYRPRALGRATRINKRTSHIVVALTPEE